MRSILLGKGPISTQASVKCNFNKLRNVNREEFVDASRKLEGFNLGSLVKVGITKGTLARDVFVKKRPEQVGNILQTMPGMCTLKEYSERFVMRVPTVISLKLRTRLMTLGYVSEKQMK